MSVNLIAQARGSGQNVGASDERRLSCFTGSRNNNFNLIRFVAASLVLFTHSFVLSTGSENAEPLRTTLGTTFGTIAVDVFFVASGFLVTGSLLGRKNIADFLYARIVRIYPGLLVAIALTVAVLGAAFSQMRLSAFLGNPETVRYIIKDSTLVSGVAGRLPGVFEHTPYKGAVNGSLWTLPYEVWMYAILAIMWLIAGSAGPMREKSLKYVVLGAAALGTVVVTANILGISAFSGVHGHLTQQYAMHLPAMFFVGSAFYLWRDRVVLSGSAFAICAATVFVSTYNRSAFAICYQLLLGYIVLYLAYIPSGWIREFNRIGDYSYGMYIYAFPIQQIIASLIPGVSPLVMLMLSFPASLVLAALSWHLIEQHALRLKKRAVERRRPSQSVLQSCEG